MIIKMDYYYYSPPIIGDYCEGEKRTTFLRRGLARIYVGENKKRNNRFYKEGDMYENHGRDCMCVCEAHKREIIYASQSNHRF